MKTMACASLLLVACAAAAAAGEVDWAALGESDVVEIVTEDADGDPRETKVWIVALDGHGFVRTNDSRWLANIRRGSPMALRVDGTDHPVGVRETADPDVVARVETAFRDKYGWLQRVMSAFRMREPTVLELSAGDVETIEP